MPGDVLVPEHGLEEAWQLELRQDEAASGRHHRRRQRAGDARRRQQLGDVGRQAERHRPIGVQLACVRHDDDDRRKTLRHNWEI